MREGRIKDAKGGEMTGRADGGCVPSREGLAKRRRNLDFGERCELAEKAPGKFPFFPSVPIPAFPQAGVFTREKTCFSIMKTDQSGDSSFSKIRLFVGGEVISNLLPRWT